MPDEPRVGERSDEYRAVCVYSLRPDHPQCGRPATVHVLVEDRTHGMVSLASCEWHHTVARLAGRALDEHAYAGFCGFPSTIWAWGDPSVCVLDDSANEPELVGATGRETRDA